MSALIFVALAVAWAVYLVPKALRHHEEVASSRSVERFSDTMRVLARREPVDRSSARLVVTPGRPAATAVAADSAGPASPEVAPQSAAGVAEQAAPARTRTSPARREAARRAARRRRRVLGTILVLNAVVVALAAFAVLSWWYVAIPAGLLVAWLVTCRLMVRSERGLSRPVRRPVARTAAGATAEDADDLTEEIAAVVDETAAEQTGAVEQVAATEPGLWDPVPVTLPTYVSKPTAARTVRTIDLDSTGVWTSGRSEADSKLAREAEEAQRAERAGEGDDQRAVGS